MSEFIAYEDTKFWKDSSFAFLCDDKKRLMEWCYVSKLPEGIKTDDQIKAYFYGMSVRQHQRNLYNESRVPNLPQFASRSSNVGVSALRRRRRMYGPSLPGSRRPR